MGALSSHGQRYTRCFAPGTTDVSVFLLPLRSRGRGRNLLNDRFDFVIINAEPGRNAADAITWIGFRHHGFSYDFPFFFNDVPNFFIGPATDSFMCAHKLF